MQIFRVESGAHLLRNLIELHMDPMPLAVCVGFQLLFGRHLHLSGAVTLAHLGYLLAVRVAVGVGVPPT
ncbi:MAG: hypothetical protein CL424_01555 [Acidimicrobiaceae bacterium]|nr:hypothetical protein [Acidimicrobiaceae bacterium]